MKCMPALVALWIGSVPHPLYGQSPSLVSPPSAAIPVMTINQAEPACSLRPQTITSPHSLPVPTMAHRP